MKCLSCGSTYANGSLFCGQCGIKIDNRTVSESEETHCACSRCSDSMAELELRPPATYKQICSSYRDLVKVWHPDRFENDPSLRNRAEEKFKQIQAAFNSIKQHKGIPVNQNSAENTGTASKKASDTGEKVVFSMLIEDVFWVTGRGAVAIGCISKGTIRPGEEVVIIGPDTDRKTTITRIEMHMHTDRDKAWEGQNIGLTLHGVDKGYVKPGMVLVRRERERN